MNVFPVPALASMATRPLGSAPSGSNGVPTAPVTATPPAVYPILFLKALRRAMGGIPAGSVLAKQELEFHAELPVDTEVSIVTWVGDKQVRRERPFVTIEFDIRDPAATYSAGDFVQDAAAAMESIWRRGHQPLFVGGTMLYFHALSHGLAVLPEADLGVRAEIDARAATAGWAELHRELAEVDPVAF